MSTDDDKNKPRSPWSPAYRSRLKWILPLRRFLSTIWSSPIRLTKRRRDGGFLYEYQGIVFVVCLFITFMQAGLLSGHTNHESTDVYPDVVAIDWDSAFGSPSTSATRQPLTEHPIPILMAAAEDKFRILLSKQSRTLRAAVTEYKRRYHQDPPKGFDNWWKFAQSNNVKMVDEYDGLVDDLAPFWRISGEELRRRAMQVGFLPDIDVVRLINGNATVENVKAEFTDTNLGARAKGFQDLLKKFGHMLPDMDFPINAKAEGRVLVPWEHHHFPNTTLQDSSGGIASMLGNSFTADWQGQSNVWEAYRRTCPPGTPARRLFSSIHNVLGSQSNSNGNFFQSRTNLAAGIEFTFAAQTDADFDFCEHPWARYTQGHLFSDWRTVPVLYPVFSPAKGKGFSDIRIPSHYYHGYTRRYTYGWDAVNLDVKEVDEMEVPWQKKSDKIFWRGATTGGGSTPIGFSHQYQRHRFVRMTSDLSEVNKTITFADPPTSSHFVSVKVPTGAINDETMDVAFVKSAGHYPDGPEALARDHKFHDAVRLGEHWSHKYLVDLDGMAYSGRFMAFLASDSAVIKSTMYQEYFSDWIQPWLHYIPLSSSYKEIYNIHAFFSGAPPSALKAANSTALNLHPSKRRSIEGDRRLRRIARAGKQWKKTIGRRADMEAYVYRLCLEYARLWADDRDSMAFKL